MGQESRHISVSIDRSGSEVYEFASNPANLPSWARGLGASVEFVDGAWLAASPMGRVVVVFAPRNQFGVLDHHVTLPSGESFYNPMRVIADGSASEVVFTMRRQPGQTEAEFAQDADTVAADLAALKAALERR